MKKSGFLVFVCVFFITTHTASAFNIDGKYIFKQKGCEGEMEVSEKSFGMNPLIAVKIGTVCTQQYHTCELEIKGTRQVSDEKSISAFFSQKKDDGNTAKFEIEFTANGAKITVIENCDYFCGLNGFFGGKWVKAAPTKKTNPIKK